MFWVKAVMYVEKVQTNLSKLDSIKTLKRIYIGVVYKELFDVQVREYITCNTGYVPNEIGKIKSEVKY